MKKRLFIIGNGFDLAHELKTKYSDFRDWMKKELLIAYPNISINGLGQLQIENNPEIPEVIMGNHGEDVFDEDKTLYMLMWLLINNVKMDAEWNQFESALYYLDLESLLEEYDYIVRESAYDKEGDINLLWMSQSYEGLASNVQKTVCSIKDLFRKWIETIDLTTLNRKNYIELLISIQDTYFLSFNYTETLEYLYNIPPTKVNHIHGLRFEALRTTEPSDIFGNKINDLIVGHGNNADRVFESEYCERDSILRETISELRKPVSKIISDNKLFWKLLNQNSFEEIYSFGLSFSEVDLPYICKVLSCIQDYNVQIKWYLNSRDDFLNNGSTKNQEYENILRKCGFKGEFDRYSVE